MPLGEPRPEKTVFVIGDIHGRADLLATLLERIEDGVQVVTVGDYIDRGEDSKPVLECLMSCQSAEPDTFACLMGNHEKMLLDFIDRPTERGPRWLRNGGLQTLASFGVGGVTEGSDPAALMAARDAFQDALGPEMERWLRSLPLQWHSGNLWVVHAAMDPDRAPEEQEDRTLIWGSGAFMQQPRKDGLWVAHGHVVVDQPQVLASRIAVDTGAYFSGRLTAARIDPDGGVGFLQEAG